MGKTALVLSAGGCFGAYQVGAWKSLEARFQPDMVIGTSIGSIHAWCIAGGASAADLEGMWLDRSRAPQRKLRMPRSWRHGVFDTRKLEAQIQELHARYRPRIPVGVVCTNLRGLRQALFVNQEITWRHLAASCAIPGVLDMPRLDGATYADGGLFDSVNAWAAVEMGATRIVAVNAWKPHRMAWIDGPLGWLAHRRRRRLDDAPASPAEVQWELIEPAGELGTFTDALHWRPALVNQWIAQGEHDAASKKHNIYAMF